MIAHGKDGWVLAEFSREVRGADIIEVFDYERYNHHDEIVDKASGWRREGHDMIVFSKGMI